MAFLINSGTQANYSSNYPYTGGSADSYTTSPSLQSILGPLDASTSMPQAGKGETSVQSLALQLLQLAIMLLTLIMNLFSGKGKADEQNPGKDLANPQGDTDPLGSILSPLIDKILSPTNDTPFAGGAYSPPGGAYSPPAADDDDSSSDSDDSEFPSDTPVHGSSTQPTTGASSPADNSMEGETETVNKPIVVKAGETFDGQGKTFVAGSGLGNGSQSEGQKPLFILEDGAKLKNVKLDGQGSGGAADGVHTRGDAQLDHVEWLNVGEDALTKEGKGTVVLNDCVMRDAEDKGIQDNAGGLTVCNNCDFINVMRPFRTKGNGQYDSRVEFHGCTFSNIGKHIGGSDSASFSGLMDNCTFDNVFANWRVDGHSDNGDSV